MYIPHSEVDHLIFIQMTTDHCGGKEERGEGDEPLEALAEWCQVEQEEVKEKGEREGGKEGES